ncbi:DUF4245 domain-containing protein [Agrococcus sp. SGAir0287]|uniref:DUF4245 domain-containing protein n=1 Tax=Agrococcus sp. SGAir0287 TaxID=2070347 RepID=UPI0010CD02B3|nr:DUF4245 domain-containing protein [Agrococcus sp. SGAir0287]QCR19803.1 DUF4245 domain-containing protein [Agrococcus sp. SGAir0287]
MSPKQPRVVAELGRPETPEEIAERKAASSARYRGSKTLVNLVAAMLATLGIVLVVVLFVMRADPAPPEPIDVPAAAADASAALGTTVVSPDLPEGWRANAAELRDGPAGIAQWYVGWITADDAFASLTQGVGADASWLAATTRDASETGSLDVDGVEWTVADQRDMDDPGNLAWVAWTQTDTSTFVVAGTASDAEMQALVEAVTAEID